MQKGVPLFLDSIFLCASTDEPEKPDNNMYDDDMHIILYIAYIYMVINIYFFVAVIETSASLQFGLFG